MRDPKEIARDLENRLENREAIEDGLMIETEEYAKVRVSEIRAACDGNPNHPKASNLLKATENHADERTVCVSRTDLMAVLKNCRVVKDHSGNHVNKYLGAPYFSGQARDAEILTTADSQVAPQDEPQSDLHDDSEDDSEEDEETSSVI